MFRLNNELISQLVMAEGTAVPGEKHRPIASRLESIQTQAEAKISDERTQRKSFKNIHGPPSFVLTFNPSLLCFDVDLPVAPIWRISGILFMT